MCMKLEHITIINSISYLGLTLRKLPDAFGLSPNRDTLSF
jgi:hypothetical protein